MFFVFLGLYIYFNLCLIQIFLFLRFLTFFIVRLWRLRRLLPRTFLAFFCILLKLFVSLLHLLGFHVLHHILVLRFLELQLLLGLLLLFLFAFAALALVLLCLFDDRVAYDFWVTIGYVVRRVLADVIEIIIVLLALVVTVGIPAVLALTDEASVFILYAVIAPESGVASSEAATDRICCAARVDASDLEHAFIACVELIAQH